MLHDVAIGDSRTTRAACSGEGCQDGAPIRERIDFRPQILRQDAETRRCTFRQPQQLKRLRVVDQHIAEESAGCEQLQQRWQGIRIVFKELKATKGCVSWRRIGPTYSAPNRDRCYRQQVFGCCRCHSIDSGSGQG